MLFVVMSNIRFMRHVITNALKSRKEFNEVPCVVPVAAILIARAITRRIKIGVNAIVIETKCIDSRRLHGILGV